jgi:hypothetical protein
VALSDGMINKDEKPSKINAVAAMAAVADKSFYSLFIRA